MEDNQARCEAQVREFYSTQRGIRRSMECMINVVNEAKTMVEVWERHCAWQGGLWQLLQELRAAATATEAAKASLCARAAACRAEVAGGNHCCGECCANSGACADCWLYGCERCALTGVCQGCVD